jgi:hypothetical protein
MKQEQLVVTALQQPLDVNSYQLLWSANGIDEMALA